MDALDLFFKKYSYKFDKGYPDMNNNQDVLLLESLLNKLGVKIKLFEEVNFGVLKNLSNPSLSDDTLKKIQSGEIFNIDVENVLFPSGGKGKTYGGKSKYTLSDLRAIINEFDKPIILTYAGTINKLRTPFGIRICEFGKASTEKGADFQKLVAINKLLSEFPDKIKPTERIAAGLGYEKMQVDNLNKNLQSITKQLGNDDVKLFIEGKDTGIKIASSEKVAGSGKADLVLKNSSGNEVFWISYKEGKYYDEGKENDITKELSKDVPFQQYGSLVTMYSKSYDKEMQEFGTYLKKEITDFLDAAEANIDSKYIFDNVDVTTLKDSSNLPEDVKGYSSSLPWKNLEKFSEGKKVDVIFFPPATFFKRSFIKTGDKQAEILAGKSVWGLDYNGISGNFGRENCNVLFQNDGLLNLEPHSTEGVIDGINISPTETGHILYNPELPIKPDDPDFAYTPSLYIRHTKELSFGYESKGKKKMIMGGRLLIMPLGKIPSTVPSI